VEHEVRSLFPMARVLRMDSDTMIGRTAHEDALGRFKAGEIDVLVGTQMIAKGLDFPGVTLVGVVSADSPLHQPDFRASERAFQLLSQVSGRAGRGQDLGRVVVQTFDPEQSCIQHAVKNNYLSFAQEELVSRKTASYPPFVELLRVVFSGEDEKEVENLALAAGQELKKLRLDPSTCILGPARTPITMINGRYRWHILVKTPARDDLHPISASLKTLSTKVKRTISKSLRVVLDADPLSML